MQQEPETSETNGSTEAAHLAARARAKRVGVRVTVASDPATPPEILHTMTADPSRAVRRALAARTDAPAELLRELARDPDLKTRQTLAENPACPPDALLTLVDDPHWSVRWSLPDHPGAGVEVRRAICRSADDVLRRLLAERSGLDRETSATLAADPAPAVRAGLAAYTDDADLLAALIAAPEPEVRVGAAQNVRATPAHLRLLADDRLAAVRAAAVQSGRLPHDAMERLAHDRSVNVRWWLATWPTTPPVIARFLLDDPDPDVAAQAQARVGRGG
ncbi:hypothetical protein ACIBG7_34495 [Nonomuraea sp. NPDC050328]|uniref:hypothetical protein n=1 Tax=Nonomuraea sp. NPDC050328 TaxID=3364361 RepID=UPI00379CCB8F